MSTKEKPGSLSVHSGVRREDDGSETAIVMIAFTAPQEKMVIETQGARAFAALLIEAADAADSEVPGKVLS